MKRIAFVSACLVTTLLVPKSWAWPTTETPQVFADGVTYELAQYVPLSGSASTRLVDLPGSAPSGGASPVYAEPANYERKIVGWMFMEDLHDGTHLQRWLLLHDFEMASEHDTEVVPASFMGGTETAPTTVEDFQSRAESCFEAAKACSPDPPKDRTRYVKSRTFGAEVLDHLLDLPADNLTAPPAHPSPTGNGAWDGNAEDQIDGGTIGIFLPGTASAALVGLVLESNAGAVGTSAWFLSDHCPAPASLTPIILASTDYMQAPGIGTAADLSAVIGSNPISSRRKWNLLREAATYYSTDFPSQDP
jgi:hypothetical protein